jgi:RimJ/RimL family protein N-acetyltransferase
MAIVVSLRPSTHSELGEALREESRADTRCWLGDISPEWHHEQMTSPDAEHLSVICDGMAAGFVVLAGLTGTHGSVEMRRVVVYSAARGRGVGAATMSATLHRAFAVHGAHRAWLDVKSHNAIALRLYRSIGLVPEGELRESVREPDGGYSSMIIMSMLDREWRRDKRAVDRFAPLGSTTKVRERNES